MEKEKENERENTEKMHLINFQTLYGAFVGFGSIFQLQNIFR